MQQLGKPYARPMPSLKQGVCASSPQNTPGQYLGIAGTLLALHGLGPGALTVAHGHTSPSAWRGSRGLFSSFFAARPARIRTPFPGLPERPLGPCDEISPRRLRDPLHTHRSGAPVRLCWRPRLRPVAARIAALLHFCTSEGRPCTARPHPFGPSRSARRLAASSTVGTEQGIRSHRASPQERVLPPPIAGRKACGPTPQHPPSERNSR
jgi:hypothetical protein